MNKNRSGRPAALNASLADVRNIVSANPSVVGYVEVEVNVYQAFETVKANCYLRDGTLAWPKKTLLNAGAAPETLAREMLGRLLKKVHGQSCQ